MPTRDNDNLHETRGENNNNNKLPQTRSKNHFSQALSLSSSAFTNQSRAPLEREVAVLNRAPTPSTVITRASPTLETSAGNSHREHADGRHDRRKRSAKQKE